MNFQPLAINRVKNPSKTITAASNVCIYTSNKMQNKISYETPNIDLRTSLHQSLFNKRKTNRKLEENKKEQ